MISGDLAARRDKQGQSGCQVPRCGQHLANSLIPLILLSDVPVRNMLGGHPSDRFDYRSDIRFRATLAGFTATTPIFGRHRSAKAWLRKKRRLCREREPHDENLHPSAGDVETQARILWAPQARYPQDFDKADRGEFATGALLGRVIGATPASRHSPPLSGCQNKTLAIRSVRATVSSTLLQLPHAPLGLSLSVVAATRHLSRPAPTPVITL